MGPVIVTSGGKGLAHAAGSRYTVATMFWSGQWADRANL